jgi:hypothetical protein
MMSKRSTTAAAGIAASIVLAAAAVAGCGDDKSSNPSSGSSATSSTASASPSSAAPTSSTPAAAPVEFSNLLIKPTDVVVPGDTFILAQTLPVPNPAGVEGVYMNQDGTRKVDITIYIYPDAATASQAYQQSVQTIPELSVKAAPTPVDVGTAAQTAVGPSPDGHKAKGIVMFTEGKTFTVLELESPPADAVQQDFIVDLGRKQDAAIKAGLPS